MDNCNTYYMIVVASIPFIAISNAGSALFRSVGNSNISMRASIVMNVVNIGGNARVVVRIRHGYSRSGDTYAGL